MILKKVVTKLVMLNERKRNAMKVWRIKQKSCDRSAEIEELDCCSELSKQPTHSEFRQYLQLISTDVLGYGQDVRYIDTSFIENCDDDGHASKWHELNFLAKLMQRSQRKLELGRLGGVIEVPGMPVSSWQLFFRVDKCSACNVLLPSTDW